MLFFYYIKYNGFYNYVSLNYYNSYSYSIQYSAFYSAFNFNICAYRFNIIISPSVASASKTKIYTSFYNEIISGDVTNYNYNSYICVSKVSIPVFQSILCISYYTNSNLYISSPFYTTSNLVSAYAINSNIYFNGVSYVF